MPAASGERFGAVHLGQKPLECLVDLAVDHLDDQIAAVDAVENPLAIAVDALALLVHHFVVFEQVLADFEVALFDLLLSAFDAAADHPAFDRFAFLHAEAGEHVLHPLAGEDPHQVVFERQVEAAAAGIALATATAAKLQVDAAGFVPLGADDVQAAQVFDFLRLRPSSARAASISCDQRRPILRCGTSSRVAYLSCSWAQAIVSALPPRMMSVPRPAMLVAMVTALLRPAWATISASRL